MQKRLLILSTNFLLAGKKWKVFTHGWRFNVRTGERPENPEIRVTCVEVRVLGTNVQVKVPLTL